MMVSIIIPFFKGNNYIKKIFRMVEENSQLLRSEDRALELIIVNDSPDEHVEIPDGKWCFPYYIHNQKRNQGIHQARVSGLNIAKGDYILFLDQDDEICSDFCAEMLGNIGDNDVIVSNPLLEEKNGECHVLYKNRLQFKKAITLKCFLKSHNQIVSPGQCLIKKNSIPKEWREFIVTINGSDDLLLWILMLSKGAHFKTYNRKLYKHSYTGENLSASEEKMTESSLSMVDILTKIDYVKKTDIDSFIRYRQLKSSLKKCNSFRKVSVIVKNVDIIVFCLGWKIVGMICGKGYDNE